jgi:hypothetical protein
LLITHLLLGLALAQAPVTHYVQAEVLAWCPDRKALAVLETELDLPYRFDDVRVALLVPLTRQRVGASSLFPGTLVARLKKNGLKPLYDVELKERRDKAVADLRARGCEAAERVVPPAGSLQGSFVVNGVTYSMDVEEQAERFNVVVRRGEGDGVPPLDRAEVALQWFAEGKLTRKPFSPYEVVQLAHLVREGLLAMVIRSRDPLRYDVPAVDYLIVLRLQR